MPLRRPGWPRLRRSVTMSPVAPLLPSRRTPPIGFAHRGARAHAPENTLEAFELALRLGATGLESDVWLTADDVAVLDHDGVVGSRLRRKRIADLRRSELPGHIPALAEVYASFGTDFELSLDVKDPAAGGPTVAVTAAADPTMASRLWLCDHDLDRMVSWREVSPHVRLVDSTRLHKLKTGPERLGARLQELRIDAVNLHHTDWSGGLVTLFHRFGIYAFGWDAQFDRTLDGLLRMGIDGVYSDHVDRMVDALDRHASRPTSSAEPLQPDS
ncbi:MAG: putative phosphodiesterase [Acidimicrobiales bacterium]|nr:putative phosphodiesterase [Acidimicrobiales bacterium]